jgi:hypothetical protein
MPRKMTPFVLTVIAEYSSSPLHLNLNGRVMFIRASLRKISVRIDAPRANMGEKGSQLGAAVGDRVVVGAGVVKLVPMKST